MDLIKKKRKISRISMESFDSVLSGRIFVQRAREKAVIIHDSIEYFQLYIYYIHTRARARLSAIGAYNPNPFETSEKSRPE